MQLYSCIISSTSPSDGVSIQRHALAVLPPGKTRYPLYGRWVGPRAGLVGCGKSALWRLDQTLLCHLSLLRAGFVPGLIRVRLVFDNVAVGHVFSQYFRFTVTTTPSNPLYSSFIHPSAKLHVLCVNDGYVNK